MQRDDRLRNRAELGIRTEHIYISREISIEHPSVGLASLAQLNGVICTLIKVGVQF